MSDTLTATREWIEFAFGWSDPSVIFVYLVVLGGIPVSWIAGSVTVSAILTGVFIGTIYGRATAVDSTN